MTGYVKIEVKPSEETPEQMRMYSSCDSRDVSFVESCILFHSLGQLLHWSNADLIAYTLLHLKGIFDDPEVLTTIPVSEESVGIRSDLESIIAQILEDHNEG